MASKSEFNTYGFEYQYQGSTWTLHVCATSEQDAGDRIQAVYYNGKVLGKLMGRIPAIVPGFGMLARVRCWLGNTLKENPDARD